MDLPSYFTNPCSYWEWFKGGLGIWGDVFIDRIWWPISIILVIAIPVFVSELLTREIAAIKDKNFWKTMLCAVFGVYIVYLTFLFAPFKAHCNQNDEWNAFVDECIENHNYELLDSVRELRYQSYDFYKKL